MIKMLLGIPCFIGMLLCAGCGSRDHIVLETPPNVATPRVDDALKQSGVNLMCPLYKPPKANVSNGVATKKTDSLYRSYLLCRSSFESQRKLMKNENKQEPAATQGH